MIVFNLNDYFPTIAIVGANHDRRQSFAQATLATEPPLHPPTLPTAAPLPPPV